MPAERLQKILAGAGVASRRAAEALIADGRVRVNGRIVRELGTKADPHKDRIDVNGKRIVSEKPVYYVLHKPRQVVTTLDDPEGRETVGKLMRRVKERVFPVGRLDYHTSGVLLLTNDGDMAQALLHPKKAVPKTYIAKFKGVLPIKALERLREGVVLDDGHRTKKAELFVVNEERGNTWCQITITEGKNRQIHRMGDAIGHRVMRLSRTAFAGVTAEGLPPGAYRPLKADELRKLKRDYKNPAKKTRKPRDLYAAEDEPFEPAPPPAERSARKARPSKKRTTKKAAAPKKRTTPKKKAAAKPPKKAGKSPTKSATRKTRAKRKQTR